MAEMCQQFVLVLNQRHGEQRAALLADLKAAEQVSRWVGCAAAVRLGAAPRSTMLRVSRGSALASE